MSYNNKAMRAIANFTQAKMALGQFIPIESQATRYTLGRMKKLMTYLGNSQDRLRIIHIAGTSGKTSTSYYIAHLLQDAGHSTGLTVSPHIDQINERAQIDLTALSESEYCAKLSQFLALVDNSGLAPSHFEVMVAFAYWLFYEKHVDYAVVEVGLGGLLDGTNVTNRPDKVCIITDIGLDHTDILGDTLAEIATQKAGIIHSGNTVFIHEQLREVMDAVQQVCLMQGAELKIVRTDVGEEEYGLPTFQRRNLSLARSAVDFVLRRDSDQLLTSRQVAAASRVYIPGRMEVVNYGNKTLVLDGSHSEQKVNALIAAMRQRFPNQNIALLVSFGDNKQSAVAENIKLLRQLGTSIIITRFSKGQDEIRSSIEPSILAAYAKDAGFQFVTVKSDPLAALALLKKTGTKVGLITGSLYLLNDLHKTILSQSK